MRRNCENEGSWCRQQLENMEPKFPLSCLKFKAIFSEQCGVRVNKLQKLQIKMSKRRACILNSYDQDQVGSWFRDSKWFLLLGQRSFYMLISQITKSEEEVKERSWFLQESVAIAYWIDLNGWRLSLVDVLLDLGNVVHAVDQCPQVGERLEGILYK
jgi:hypothetical protein